MKLSKRLEHLALMVSNNRRIADIGTDHGFLPIKLVLEEVVQSAVAMDLRSGPLERAREHIREYGLEERIQTRLSDGMLQLQEEEVDTIIIAGLGGELMIEILDARRDLHQKEFILSPHSEWKSVRRYLRKMHMEILDEDMVCEEKKYYIFLKVRGTSFCKETIEKNSKDNQKSGFFSKYDADDRVFTEKKNVVNEKDIFPSRYDYFGEILIQKKHPELLSYLEREKEKYTRILESLQAQGADESKQVRIREIQTYLEMIHITWSEMQ